MLIKLDDFLRRSRYNPQKKHLWSHKPLAQFKGLELSSPKDPQVMDMCIDEYKEQTWHPSVFRIYMSNNEHQYGPPRLLPAPLTQLTLGCNGLRQFVFTLLILNIATWHPGKHVFFVFRRCNDKGETLERNIESEKMSGWCEFLGFHLKYIYI